MTIDPCKKKMRSCYMQAQEQVLMVGANIVCDQGGSEIGVYRIVE